jgi:hypothetical protein
MAIREAVSYDGLADCSRLLASRKSGITTIHKDDMYGLRRLDMKKRKKEKSRMRLSAVSIGRGPPSGSTGRQRFLGATSQTACSWHPIHWDCLLYDSMCLGEKINSSATDAAFNTTCPKARGALSFVILVLPWLCAKSERALTSVIILRSLAWHITFVQTTPVLKTQDL